MENGSPATTGTCPVCGGKLFKMGRTDAHAALPVPESKPKAAKAAVKKTAAKGKTASKSAAPKSAASTAAKSTGKATTKAKTTVKKSTGTKAGSKSTKRADAAPKRRSGRLVIVESPAKAKSVGRYLGDGYTVKASKGHVRDLLSSRLSVDLENNFEPTYRVMNDKRDTVAELRRAAETASEIYLATDPDREGEAIAWHLISAADMEESRVKRVVFHEITEQAVKEAFSHPREVDMSLVNAQQARRILDRIALPGVGIPVGKGARTPVCGARAEHRVTPGRRPRTRNRSIQNGASTGRLMRSSRNRSRTASKVIVRLWRGSPRSTAAIPNWPLKPM